MENSLIIQGDRRTRSGSQHSGVLGKAACGLQVANFSLYTHMVRRTGKPDEGLYTRASILFMIALCS
jgi:hypothetical protein